MLLEGARVELLRRLDQERTQNLGPWEYEPAKPGYITTIFGRYKSGDAAGIAYACSGEPDQQNADAEFICAAANSLGPLLDERAAILTKLARYGAALREISEGGGYCGTIAKRALAEDDA